MTAERTADFINSIGVNTHIEDDDLVDANTSLVVSSLNYLGIDHVREGDAGTSINQTWYYNQYAALAEAGIKFDFVINPNISLSDDIYFLDRMETLFPGSINSVEGSNEVTDSTTYATGGSGLSAVLPTTEAIFNAITEDPKLNGVSIYADTFHDWSDASQVGDLGPYVTDGNAHVYFESNAPGVGLGALSEQTVDAPGDPQVITETGYATDPGYDPGSGAMNTNDDVQAKYTLDLLFDDIKAGVQTVYIYDLLDDVNDPNDTADQWHFGLFNYDGSPKPSAIAIHNLTTILGDTSSTASTFVTGNLNYTIAGLPEYSTNPALNYATSTIDGIRYENFGGSSYLMQKSNGAFDLAVWVEPQIWNYATVSEMVAPPLLATVTLDQTYDTVEVFDPMVSSSPIEILHNISRLQVIVTDHPIIIEVEPNGTSASADNQAIQVQSVFQISGIAATQTVADNATLLPFSNIEVTDSQVSGDETATIILNDSSGNATDANGSLSGSGLTKISTGTYWVTADSAADLSAALQSLVFTPTNHEAAPGQSTTTQVTLLFSDGTNTGIDTGPRIAVGAQDTAPGISGTVAIQRIQDTQTLQPFAKTVVTDVDFGAADSVTITLVNASGNVTDADGTLTGSGLKKTGTGTYSLAASTPSAVTTELKQLLFTPAIGQVVTGQIVTTGFDLAVSDGTDVTTNTASSVQVTATGPVIGGAWIVSINDNRAGGINALRSVTVADAQSAGSETATITLRDSNGNLTDANGSLSATGLNKIATGTYSINAASPAAMAAAINQVFFAPTNHQVAPGQSVATQITVNVSDGVRTGSLNASTVTVLAQENAPGITGTVANQTAGDSQPFQPFANTVITDPDFGATDSVTITLVNASGSATDADGTLSGPGLTKTGTGSYSLAANTPSAVTAELERLLFTPTIAQVQPGQSVTTGFQLTVTDGTDVTTNTAGSVKVTSNGPVIGGAWILSIADNRPGGINPLRSVTVTDSQSSGSETATITLLDSSGNATDANGSLSAAGLAKISAGTYRISAASPAAMAAAINQVIFTPTNHQVAPGQSVATDIMLSISDGVRTGSFDASTVTVVAQETAPGITGTVANQAATDSQPLQPFANTVITDPDFGATDSVTITLVNAGGTATDADGTLSGTGLTKTGTGIYSLAVDTPSAMTAELERLVFTPTVAQVQPGQSVTTGFHLVVSDGNDVTTNTTSSVNAASNGPVLGGAWTVSIADNRPGGINPLRSVTVTDTGSSGSETATITLLDSNGNATDANGSLSAAGLTKISAGTYSISAASPAAMAAAINQVYFTPTNHQVAPGQSVSTEIMLSVSDGMHTGSYNASTVTAVAQQTAPSITGTVANQAAADTQPLQPFSSTVITDPDFGATGSVTITLVNASGTATDADGVLSGSGPTKTGTGTYSLAAASPAAVTAELEHLVFTPTVAQVAIGQSVTTGFHLALSDGGYVISDTTSSVKVISNGLVISGTSIASISDNSPGGVNPLRNVSIVDTQSSGSETTTITLLGSSGNPTDANGVLSGSGLTKIGVGTYSISAASPATMTAAIDQVIFTPTNHQVVPGQSVATQIMVSVSDGARTASLNASTVTAVAQETAPSITGMVANQNIQDTQTIQPFANAVISDIDFGANDSVTITLVDATGTATDADGVLTGSGLTKTGNGTYSLAADTPGTVTAELEQLVFTPTTAQVAIGQSVTTGFDLTVSDGTDVTTNTTSLVKAASNGPVLSGAWTVSIADNRSGGINALHSISVVDTQSSGSETATFTLVDSNGNVTDANGALSGSGLTKIGVGTYSISAASPSAMSAAIDQVIFNPTNHQVTPGQSVATQIMVGVSDGVHTGFYNASTVTAVAQETAPAITGTVGNQTIQDSQTTQPFASTVITDPDFGATNSVTITLVNASGTATDADGKLSGAGLTKTGTGTYSLAADTPSAVTAELEQLLFTPTFAQVPIGQSVTTGFRLAVTDGSYVTTNTTSSVKAASNGPVLSGAWTVTIADNRSGGINALHSISVVDTQSSGSETATFTLVDSSGNVTDANGALSGSGLTKIGVGTYSISAASPSAMSAAIDQVIFNPTNHQVTPGQSVVTQIMVGVSDGVHTGTYNASTVTAVAQETAPTITGTVGNLSIADAQTVQPFANVVIADPDFGATSSVTITLTNASGSATDADGTLSGTGLTKTGTGTYTLAAGTPSAVTTELEKLVFTPTIAQVQPGQSVTTGLRLAVTDGAMVATNTASSVKATAIGPVLSGAWILSIADNRAGGINPLHSVNVTDTQSSGSETTTITLLDSGGNPTDANGSLSATGLTKIGVGTYSISAASPAAMTTAIDQVIFTPTNHQVTPGQSVATQIMLSVSDGVRTGSFSASTVTTIAQNTPPSITGAVGNQMFQDIQAQQPFANTVITDPDYGAAETVTITLVNSAGSVTDADGALSGAGLTKTGTGTYSLAAATPSAVTSELAQLLFTPTISNVRVNTTLDLAVSDGTYTSTNNSTFLVVSSANATTATTIATGGAFTLVNGASATGTINFAGSNGTLTVEGSALPTATISGFDLNGAAGDAIVLTNSTYVDGRDTVTLGANNVLTLNLNGDTEKLNLDPSADYTGHSFYISTNSLDQVVVLDPVSTAAAPKMSFLAPSSSTSSVSSTDHPSLDKNTIFTDSMDTKFAARFASSIPDADLGSLIRSAAGANIASIGLNDLVRHSAFVSAASLHS